MKTMGVWTPTSYSVVSFKVTCERQNQLSLNVVHGTTERATKKLMKLGKLTATLPSDLFPSHFQSCFFLLL